MFLIRGASTRSLFRRLRRPHEPSQTIFRNDPRGLWISPEALPDAVCGRCSPAFRENIDVAKNICRCIIPRRLRYRQEFVVTVPAKAVSAVSHFVSSPGAIEGNRLDTVAPA